MAIQYCYIYVGKRGVPKILSSIAAASSVALSKFLFLDRYQMRLHTLDVRSGEKVTVRHLLVMDLAGGGCYGSRLHSSVHIAIGLLEKNAAPARGRSHRKRSTALMACSALKLVVISVLLIIGKLQTTKCTSAVRRLEQIIKRTMMQYIERYKKMQASLVESFATGIFPLSFLCMCVRRENGVEYQPRARCAILYLPARLLVFAELDSIVDLRENYRDAVRVIPIQALELNEAVLVDLRSNGARVCHAIEPARAVRNVSAANIAQGTDSRTARHSRGSYPGKTKVCAPDISIARKG
jgi:hypothetical protein